jgi:lipopolysaccharide biosynthesis glycosyltransferase
MSIPVVAFVADDRFAMPLAAAIASVITNFKKGQKLDVFIVDAGVSRRDKDRIAQLEDRKQVNIKWLYPSKSQRDLLKSLPYGYCGRPPYYKMFLPELLGPEYPRIVYLDSDVIVEADITEIWESALGENYVLAVQDLINPFVSSPCGLKKWRELNRRADDELFNTGVLLINAAKWQKENIGHRLVEYLRSNYRYVLLCDQDAMNAVFQNKWGRLNARWNVLPFMNKASRHSLLNKKSHEDLIMHAHVLHYCGSSKPWNARCRHLRRERFFHYLDMTAWTGWRPKSSSIATESIACCLRSFQGVLRRRFNINLE